MAPFDQRWGLVGGQSSPGLRRLVCFLAARLTHEEVSETVGKVLPVEIAARQVGNLLQPVGEAFRQREDMLVQQILQQGVQKQRSEEEQQEEQGDSIRRVYVEMDGIMVRERRGSVPMDKQEQQEERDVYREVKVGVVFRGEPGRHRSELGQGAWVDEPVNQQYVARQASAEEFAPWLYALAHRAGVSRARQVVVLGDGARWIWNLAAEQFPGAVQIVDLSHAQEHVWQVAKAVFAADPQVRDGWATSVIEHLCEGRIDRVIAAIEKLPRLAPEPGKEHSLLETEAEYFRTNQDRMRYPQYRAQGIHVGSGIAEASCKTVVTTRVKRTGMRWTPAGLDALLALRTAVLNHTFEQDWHDYRLAG